MANICTNIFYASSGNEQTIKIIRTFLEKNFPDDWHEQLDEYQIERELYSRWHFSQSLFEKLGKSLRDDTIPLYVLPIP